MCLSASHAAPVRGVFVPGYKIYFPQYWPSTMDLDPVDIATCPVRLTSAYQGTPLEQCMYTPSPRLSRRDMDRATKSLRSTFLYGWTGAYNGFHAYINLSTAMAELRLTFGNGVLLLVWLSGQIQQDALQMRATEQTAVALLATKSVSHNMIVGLLRDHPWLIDAREGGFSV